MNQKEIVETMSLIQLLGARANFEDKENRYIFTCPICKEKSSFILYKKGYGRCSSCDLEISSSSDYYTKVLLREIKTADKTTVNRLDTATSYLPKHDNSLGQSPLSVWRNKNEELLNSIKSFSDFDFCKKGSADELNFIYRMFMNLNSLVGKPKLNDYDSTYLLGRGLTFKDLVRNEYFSMPDASLVTYIVDELTRLNILKILKVIPGFYYNKSSCTWNFAAYNGICIPIKTATDKIVGIQIRLTNTKNSKLKYIWFSSPKESREDKGLNSDLCFGTSSGSPLGIMLADSNPLNFMAIVEGHFKALSTSLIGIDTFEMQGVNSFSVDEFQYIVDELKMQKRYSEEIVILFDADFIINYRVVMAILNLCSKLAPIANVKIAYWDLSKGKGIDDYLDNGHSFKDIKLIAYEDFIEPANELITRLKRDLNPNAENLMNFFESLL